MGAGKSVIGRRLANELEVSFLDLDKKIESETGQSIPQIFNREGEVGFRAVERRTLMQVIREFEGVISLGGGSLQTQHLVDHIKLNGLLVFIQTPISVILDRILDDENRPLLLDKQGDPKGKGQLKNELTALYEQRLPFYEQAVISIKNDGNKTVKKITEQLLNKIKNHVEYY